MTERESMAQVRADTQRAKGGKGKASTKKGKPEASSQPQEQALEHHRNKEPEPRPPTSTRATDPELTVRIQQRAYQLYEAGGFEQGRELDHWLKAEREIAGSSDQSNREGGVR